MKNFIFYICASKFEQVHVISQYKYKWIPRACYPSTRWCPVDISVPSRYFDLSISCLCFKNTKSISLVITLSMEILAFKSIFSASVNQFKSFSNLTLLIIVCEFKLINLSDIFQVSHDQGINIISCFHSLIEQKKCGWDNNLVKLFVCFLDINQFFLG